MIDREWIQKNLINTRGLNNWITKPIWWSNRGWSAQYDWLIANGSSIEETLYLIYNGHTSCCKICQKPTEFLGFADGYRPYCSRECMWSSEERNKKISGKLDYQTIQEKVKVTNLERYGVEHWFDDQQNQIKCREGKLQRYGDPTYSNQEKAKQTCLEKYGVEYFFDIPGIQKHLKKLKLDKYGSHFPGSDNTSGAEIEIRDWLNSLGFNFKSSYTTLPHGLELDCYDPSCKFAFEYCGLYWHSTRYKSHSYHKNKMDLAKKCGLTLITIFEDEWLGRKDQVKAFIKSKLGIFDRRIHARKCHIVEGTDRNQAKIFFNENHIQGFSSTTRRWFYLLNSSEVLGGASFSLHHRNSSKMTLARLAFINNVQVIGGVGKLIAHAKQSIGPFITWSDNRWTDGLVYEKCGLKLDGEVYADYSYVYKQQRIPKQKMVKKNIGCPEEITETEFCKNLGLYQIYDCGKKRWIYNGENE